MAEGAVISCHLIFLAFLSQTWLHTVRVQRKSNMTGIVGYIIQYMAFTRFGDDSSIEGSGRYAGDIAEPAMT